ncbi:restriction endonuclease subunit S [Lacticaseibacillus kribbianus]|uniref:restriction endonuclease subunit S n=1 Tax=Lacticaseibacillus kribbianus TaxID=2926292 RepID=UPI001CD4CB18
METKNYRLGDVVEVVDTLHSTAPVAENDTQYRMIRTANVRDGHLLTDTMKCVTEETYDKWTRRGTLEVGDVILTREAPMGEVGIIKRNDVRYFLGQRTLRLRPVSDVLNNEFLYYYLQGSYMQNQIGFNEGTGATVSNIRIPILLSMRMELPTLDFQLRMVQILDAIDSRIELNQQINSNLLKLSSNIVMVASLKAEQITDLQTLLSSSRKANISTDEISLDTYVSNTSLRANKRGLNTAEDYPSVKSVRSVDPGDILVGNIRPYFKKIWFADRKGGASNDVLTFHADSAVVTPEFLFGILYSDRFFDYVTTTSKGTKMPRGDKQAIELYQVGLPDKGEIASVTDVVKPMLEQVSLNERQNRQLTELRNLLLPKLLAGDIDLSNIETVMNNA